MITKKILDGEIANLVGLSDMIKAYEEIAAGRIMHSRELVLTNRNFIEELSEIFQEVVASYRRQFDELVKSKNIDGKGEFSFLNKNGKTLFLLVSANTGLYGSLVKRTFDLFVENSKGQSVDKAIIGRLGLSMWQQTKLNDKYYYFDFPDQRVDEEEFKKILDFIVSYEKIIIFYGRFQNLVTQNPTYSDISGNAPQVKENTPKEEQKYLFEPSLEKIMEFFEKQIFASILEQTMRESQLAKIASRITTLDAASENINKRLNLMTSEKIRTTHRQINKKQLETFTSRVLWGKT
jgi:ATP synthase F1 gamma subunit